MSPFLVLRVSGDFFTFTVFCMIISVNKHSVDPDQTPLCAALELDLHSLHMTPKQVSGPEVIIF